jgi:serine O-acetyltransferase
VVVAHLGRLIAADFRRHTGNLMDPGVWALTTYRLGVWAEQLPAGAARRLARAASETMAMALAIAARTSIPPSVKVGEAFHLIHAMNVTIAAGVQIGDRVGIMHEVTIGPDREGKGVPRIGNDVFIGVGATLLGPITIGDGAMIAANSMVITDVPARTFAVGVPAKVVRWGMQAAAAPPAGAPPQTPST